MIPAVKLLPTRTGASARHFFVNEAGTTAFGPQPAFPTRALEPVFLSISADEKPAQALFPVSQTGGPGSPTALLNPTMGGEW